MDVAELIAAIVAALIVAFVVVRAVRIIPQARVANVERLGRYRKTLDPGLHFVIPFVDRVRPLIDLRVRVVSFPPRSVITEDNLVVDIDTVLYFQVTDPRAAAYEIHDYIEAIEQLTVTTLRNVIGGMDLEKALTSRDQINDVLRGVLDEATDKWGIRVNRVEIKAIDPPATIKQAMEKQMRAERDKRAAILNAEGVRQSQVLEAEGQKQSNILRAEGDRQSQILRAEGQAKGIHSVFQAIHENDPDPKLLAYQYLQALPRLAQGQGNTVFVIPSEVTNALGAVTRAFTENLPPSTAIGVPAPKTTTEETEPTPDSAGTDDDLAPREITSTPSLQEAIAQSIVEATLPDADAAVPDARERPEP